MVLDVVAATPVEQLCCRVAQSRKGTILYGKVYSGEFSNTLTASLAGTSSCRCSKNAASAPSKRASLLLANTNFGRGATRKQAWSNLSGAAWQTRHESWRSTWQGTSDALARAQVSLLTACILNTSYVRGSPFRRWPTRGARPRQIALRKAGRAVLPQNDVAESVVSLDDPFFPARTLMQLHLCRFVTREQMDVIWPLQSADFAGVHVSLCRNSQSECWFPFFVSDKQFGFSEVYISHSSRQKLLLITSFLTRPIDFIQPQQTHFWRTGCPRQTT